MMSRSSGLLHMYSDTKQPLLSIPKRIHVAICGREEKLYTGNDTSIKEDEVKFQNMIGCHLGTSK
jgi:hypothetical protein